MGDVCRDVPHRHSEGHDYRSILHSSGVKQLDNSCMGSPAMLRGQPQVEGGRNILATVSGLLSACMSKYPPRCSATLVKPPCFQVIPKLSTGSTQHIPPRQHPNASSCSRDWGSTWANNTAAQWGGRCKLPNNSSPSTMAVWHRREASHRPAALQLLDRQNHTTTVVYATLY